MAAVPPLSERSGASCGSRTRIRTQIVSPSITRSITALGFIVNWFAGLVRLVSRLLRSLRVYGALSACSLSTTAACLCGVVPDLARSARSEPARLRTIAATREPSARVLARFARSTNLSASGPGRPASAGHARSLPHRIVFDEMNDEV